MIILGLDASTVAIGWALLDYEQVYQYGVKDLTVHGDFDQRLFAAGHWMDIVGINLTPYPAVVAIEEPVLRTGSKSNPDTMRKLAYVDGALAYVALQNGLKVVRVLPGARLSALGLPIRLRRDTAKAHVLQLVNARYGLKLGPKEHDAADAIAVALAGYNVVMRESGGQNNEQQLD